MRNHFLPAVLSVALAVTTASVQAQGFDVNGFDASEVGSDWFAGDSLDFRVSRQPAFGLVVNSSKSPLAAYDAQGNKLVSVIKQQLQSSLQARFLFNRRFRLAMNLPLLLQQSREMVRVDGVLYQPAKGFHVGDLRFAGDTRLIGRYGDVFSLAAGAQLFVPTGSSNAFVGDKKVRLASRLMIAGDISLFSYSLRTSFVFRPQHVGFGNVPTGSQIALVATAGVRLFNRHLLVGPELWGTTGIGKNSFLKYETTPIELLFGGHFFLGPIRVGAGAGSGLTRGLGAPDYRIVASLAYVGDVDFDRDGDSIPDVEDACPFVAGVVDENRALNGCPLDRDNDGAYDFEDACPDVAGVVDRRREKNGCPRDRDGDGILDNVDACADEAGIASDDPAKNGCVDDEDSDGILDEVDACPSVYGVASPDASISGCPLDRDGDGIIDEEDACPELKGSCL